MLHQLGIRQQLVNQRRLLRPLLGELGQPLWCRAIQDDEFNKFRIQLGIRQESSQVQIGNGLDRLFLRRGRFAVLGGLQEGGFLLLVHGRQGFGDLRLERREHGGILGFELLAGLGEFNARLRFVRSRRCVGQADGHGSQEPD